MDQISLGSGNELGGTAVFFDLENIVLGIHETFQVHKIIDHLTERGEVMIRRAYADWGRYRGYQRQFLEEGVQMVFLPSYGTSDKNRTDTAICVDAMEILFSREQIDTFVIVSGDSDFGVLAQRLRDYGKRIVGVSARSAASQILVKQCHEFIFYESLAGMAMKDYSRDEGETRMQRALVQLMDEYGRRFRASLLKDRMRKHDSTFSEKNYGASNFTRFLKSYSRLVRVLDGGNVEVLWSPEGDVTESATARPNGASPPRGASSSRGAASPPRGARHPAPAMAPTAVPAPTAAPAPMAAAAPAPAVTTAPSTGRPGNAAPEPDRPSGPAAKPVKPSQMTPALQRETAELLARAFTQTLGGGRSVRMGQIKETLISMKPAFDEGQLGFRSFASFLKAFPEVVSLDRYRDNVRPVEPLSEPVPAPPLPAASPDERHAPARPDAAEQPAAPPSGATSASKPAAKKPAAKKAAAKKPAAKKPAAKKPAVKKPAAKKPATKKPAAKKAAAKKPAAKKATRKTATS